MNTKLIALPERAMDLAGKWGGDVMELVPRAGQWLDAGVKIGAVKTGGKVAMKFVRKYPVVAVATVVGAGALWYLARRKAKQAQNGDGRDAIEGSARRVPAKRASATKRPARKTTRATTTASE
ncbi:hypothetical protein [Noviluteimonas gilva]|uniref:Transmembrane protein n=1 Tax=Noviluteimonas gilva TaxID=2682097 RepID=A0A7C9HKX3_9GAMM|nr:hypothetical protein [Lysobacter gilvus]MUV13170.1 hypothetical protein [Lysobacter gilvus]